MRSGRAHTTAIAVSVLLLVGCSGDDERPEGLTDIRDTDPPEEDVDADGTDDPDEPDEADEADEGEGDEPVEGDDPDETEVEDHEPHEADEGGITVSGVFVPDDAFQINDELDLEESTQREYLQFVLDAYLSTTQALNTGEWEGVEWADYYAGEELERNVSGFERYQRDGLRQVNDGTVVSLMRVARFDGAGILVHKCVTRGPDDGVINAETGEYEFRSDQRQRSLATFLALVEIATDLFDYRIIEIGGADGDVCT